MPLEAFYVACKIAYWGSLDEPPKSEYESFLLVFGTARIEEWHMVE